jgi:hypothetical protein
MLVVGPIGLSPLEFSSNFSVQIASSRPHLSHLSLNRSMPLVIVFFIFGSLDFFISFDPTSFFFLSVGTRSMGMHVARG